MGIGKVCDAVMRIAFSLLFLLVPLVLTTVNFELFEYNKMMLTYALAAVIATVWGIKAVALREWRIARTPLDIPIGLFLLSQFLSTFLSMDPHVSWFGYYSRFNGGMWSTVAYVVLYYAFVSNLLPERETPKSDATAKKPASKERQLATRFSAPGSMVRQLLRIMITTGFVVAAYGIAEHFGIDKHVWVQDVQSRVFSTLGQPNWLAAYMVAILPVAVALAFAAIKQAPGVTRTPRISVPYLLYMGAASIFFLTLLYTRSRSGLLGLAVADLIFWAMVWTRLESRHARFQAIVFHAILGLILFFTGTHIPAIDRLVTFGGWRDTVVRKPTAPQQPQSPEKPSGPILETGGTESGVIRSYVWQAAISTWKSSPKTILFGTGTETFAFAFFRHKPVGHNLTSEWDFLYNKAHNEYLNFLATTGLFGLLTYLALLGTTLTWAIRTFAAAPTPAGADATDWDKTRIVASGMIAGYASILVTNFFGFSVVITQLILYLFPAILLALWAHAGSGMTWRRIPLRLDGDKTAIAYGAIVLACVVILRNVVVSWLADREYAYGHNLARAGQYVLAYEYLTRAVGLVGNEPAYRDERAGSMAVMALEAAENKQASQAALLARASIAEIDRAISQSPNNVNLLKTKTKVLYTLSELDPAFTTEAITTLTEALALSPLDPKIVYNLAILYGRIGKKAEAVSYLKKTIEVKRDYRDAYYALSVFHKDAGREDLARDVINSYLKTVDSADAEFRQMLQ